MWINHAFYLIRLISATWIMCGPTTTRTTVEVIVVACSVERRTRAVHRDGLWHYTGTLLWNLFDQFTAEGPRFLHHEASRTFLASDPVVDVTLDKEFFSNGAPQSKVHGFIMRLAQWNCGGHSCVSAAGCPCRPWSDSVCARREAWIRPKSNLLRPSVVRNRLGKRCYGNQHPDQSSRRLTWQKAPLFWDPCNWALKNLLTDLRS